MKRIRKRLQWVWLHAIWYGTFFPPPPLNTGPIELTTAKAIVALMPQFRQLPNLQEDMQPHRKK